MYKKKDHPHSRDGLFVLANRRFKNYFLVESITILPLSLMVESMCVFGESTGGLGAGVGPNKLQDATVKVIAITLAIAIVPFFIFQSFKCD